MHRTQILLDPEQHQALAEMARREGRSISDIVRAMVGEQLALGQQTADAVLQRQLAAAEWVHWVGKLERE